MTRKHKIKLKDIILDIYRELYEKSTPSVDFDMLVENAEIDEFGRKIIPYDDYEIEGELLSEIINKYISKNKLKKIDAQIIKCEVYLGVSPKIKDEKYKNYDK